MQEKEIVTPYFLINERLLKKNLECLNSVMKQSECQILLAQKCFSMFSEYPLIAKYLSGTTASGLYEAKLGYDYMGKPFQKQTHVFSAAYREDEMDEITSLCDHISFNSFQQWMRYKTLAKKKGVSCGIRINPEFQTQEGHEIYDPCAPFSRLGVTIEQFKKAEKNGLLEGIEGLHFHTLCEQNSDDLEKTLKEVERKFGSYLHQMKWLNMGGGHHITREDYDIERLIACIRHIKDTYHVEVYLEPGEAVALNAGFLKTRVLDIVENGKKIAILDASAACHMPDVLEMPYRPEIIEAREAGKEPYTYRLGGPTCLAGDVIGEYSFDHPLQIGETLTFCDMAIYSMVKTNTFNGMKLPDIYLEKEDGIHLVKRFGYEDFRMRLS